MKKLLGILSLVLASLVMGNAYAALPEITEPVFEKGDLVGSLTIGYGWGFSQRLALEYAVADGKEPKHSFDTSIPRWTSWPKLGEEQIVELKLRKSQTVESISVYWYDDKGGVQLPVEWSAEYLSGAEWHKFTPYITDSFGVAKDQYNVVHPAHDVKADAVRLRIKPKADAAVGILEAKIE